MRYLGMSGKTSGKGADTFSAVWGGLGRAFDYMWAPLTRSYRVLNSRQS